MKKIVPFCLLALFLAACAGNPPAWWNPNNRYGSTDDKTAANPAVLPVVKPQEPVITEEEMEPLPDTTYEEVTLTPMVDEENENNSGAAASQDPSLTPQTDALVPSVLD